MINEPTTAQEQVRALAAAVRDGELTPGQRERFAELLHTLGRAVAAARRDHYPDNDSAALGYLIATWAPVQRDFAELAAMVCRDGEGHTA
jgi:hypothetical protein